MTWGLLLVLGLVAAAAARPESDGEPESGPAPDNPDERVSYEGAQVIQLDANTDKEIIDSILEKKEVDQWNGNKTHLDIFVPSSSASSIKSLLMDKNVSYTIMIEDVQRAIDVENVVEDDEDEFAGRKGHKMTWKSYHSLDDIYGYLDFLAETYPSQVRVGTAGTSVEGRPIKYIVISSGNPNAKKFWIDGGIHAREWISPATVTYIISELVENRDKNQQIASDIDYYIAPVINPDGYEYTRRYQRLWRKNRSKGNYFCPGVDLNRNWGFKWGGLGTSNENCREIYRGTGPFSEPETRAVSSFILNNRDNMKESWKETELQLVEKVLKLEKRLSLNVTNLAREKDELGGHLKQAYELVKKLEAELDRFKDEKEELKKENDDLTVDVMRMNCELEEYKREYENWNKNENDKLALLESNAIIQSKLSQVNTEVTRKQTEIIRLNGEIGRLRGELEKIRLGSVVNHAADSTNAISQLQAALAMERDNCNTIARERDCLNNEVGDLRKQVALLDNSGYGNSGANANKIEEKMVSQRQMTAELEATRYKIELEHNKKIYVDLQNKYDRDIVELGQQIKKLQKENMSLKHLLNDQAKQQPRKQALANSKMKEDAHLLATIRGLQGELNSREKDVQRLNKELIDAKKTNRRLQQEREKALNSSTSKMRGSQYGKETEPSRPSSECSAHQSTKDYNPLAFEDNQEAQLFLRNENRTMLEEIKRLEQDLISLHNKRIQDMSDLQEQHDRELSSMRREHATKHSSSTVAHLQGQLYTQQMVIHHLKQQIKEYEERFEEFSILKAERDHFERALMTANQKIARLNQLASPENVQYAGLLEKLEYLERRHEIREEKLQSIVKDLIAKQKKGTCSENCRDKILNKNREICYYRAEMDKILATLAEFRWN